MMEIKLKVVYRQLVKKLGILSGMLNKLEA